MNIPTALLPHKHVAFSRSLVGIAGLLLQVLDEPRTVEELMALSATDSKSWLYRPSFTEILLSVYMLYALKQIRLVHGDRLQKVVEAK